MEGALSPMKGALRQKMLRTTGLGAAADEWESGALRFIPDSASAV